MGRARMGLFTVLAAMIACVTPATAGDAMLSGSVTSAAGEKLGGVTVSAKPVGGTSPRRCLPTRPVIIICRRCRRENTGYWAQALTFKTTKAEVDLPAAGKQSFVLDPLKDFVRQLPGISCSRPCRRTPIRTSE